MIRTSVSFCVLLGGLFFATRLLEQTAADEKRPGLAIHSAENSAADQTATQVRRNAARLAERLRRGLEYDRPARDQQTESPSATAAPAEQTAEPAHVSTRRTGNPGAVADRRAIAAPRSNPQSLPASDEPQSSESSAPQQPAPRAASDLSPSDQKLRDQIRACLAYYFERPENAAERSPWGVMHALIAYGVDTEIYAGGKKVNAIGWLCWNGPCRGQQLLYVRGRDVLARQGPGYEGHRGQFLAMLAQSRVADDFVLKVDGHDLTIRDLIRSEQRSCRSGEELTFKLIGLSHYLDSEETWENEQGQTWSIPDLIREELAQPVIGAACGGTHRMMGFSYAVGKREQRGEPVTGQWLRARKYVDEYHDYTLRLQNPDGSFSTDWFAGRAHDPSLDRRVQTTGHILEWLVYSLPKDQLGDPRVVKSVQYLTDVLWKNRGHGWEIGPKGHALHALALYDERVFDGRPGQRAEQLLAADSPRQGAAVQPKR